MDSIFADWKKAIKAKNACVGLDIANFAASHGPVFRQWYRSVYAGDSAFVHQSDTSTYLAITEDDNFTPRIYTTAEQVSDVLHRSAMLYLDCIEEMNKRFRFGVDAAKAIAKFGKRLREGEK